MTSFTVALLAGFAGSFHCVGMCGGFACGVNHARGGNASAAIARNLLYNTGRLASYAFIGALAGAFGATIVDGQMAQGAATGHAMTMVLAGEIGLAQRVLSLVAGLLMLLMGFELLGLRRHAPRTWGAIGAETLAAILRALIRSPRPAAPLALGVANGFLPCPLVFAFAATAAATGAVAPAVSTMIAFGLGTFPAMFLMGATGVLISPRLRLWGVRVAGIFVALIGAVTVARGLLPALASATHAVPAI